MLRVSKMGKQEDDVECLFNRICDRKRLEKINGA